MKTQIILDDASKIVIDTYKLIEIKQRDYAFDGINETNRKYIFYILLKQQGNQDEVWDNPFLNHEHISIQNLILHDEEHIMHVLMKVSSINKYEMDHAIDHFQMLVEGPGHYQLIKNNNKFHAKEGTPFLDFISFFRWN